MPCIWGRHNKKQLFLNVAIIPADTFGALSQADAAPKNPSEPQIANLSMFKALLDTGATTTCITKKVADSLGLTPIGKVQVQGVAGPSFLNNYLFHVGFAFGMSPGQDDKSQIGGVCHVLPAAIQGAEFHSGSAGFDVLLGMDVLGLGSFKLEGDGTFSFSF
jgi:hypothetical protein